MRNNYKTDKRELGKILNLIHEYLENSEDTPWAGQDVDEVIKIVNGELRKLDTGAEINKEALVNIFLPTSSLQEISIANGWSEEYLKLSSLFDKAIAGENNKSDNFLSLLKRKILGVQ